MDTGSGTVLEHIMKAVLYSRNHLGRHGICDIRRCDRNDSLTAISRGGGAESVFVFFQMAHAAYELRLARVEPVTVWVSAFSRRLCTHF